MAKLEWSKLAGSARQIDDVAAILRVQGSVLDTAYVERWVKGLDLEAQWKAASRAVTM